MCVCVWEGERERGDREHERGGEEGSIPTLPPLLMCVCVCVVLCVCVRTHAKGEGEGKERDGESVRETDLR